MLMKKILSLKTLGVLLACLSCALGAAAYDFANQSYTMFFNALDGETCEVTYENTSYNSYS